MPPQDPIPPYSEWLKTRKPPATDIPTFDQFKASRSTRPRNQAQAEADVANARTQFEQVQSAYLSAEGRKLNPPVDTATPSYFRPLTPTEQAAKQRGEPVIIREAAPQPTKPTKSYDTTLSPAEERSFQEWKKTYAPKDSGMDYDLRGAYKAGMKPDSKTGHWPDTFKKPNHPTFSNQSKYAVGTDAAKAGRWEGDKYIPPQQSPVAPELTSRPRTITPAPVSLDPVIQGRMEQIEREKRQRETQQKVEQARQVMQRHQGLMLPVGQRNQGAAYQPTFGKGQTYREWNPRAAEAHEKPGGMVMGEFRRREERDARIAREIRPQVVKAYFGMGAGVRQEIPTEIAEQQIAADPKLRQYIEAETERRAKLLEEREFKVSRVERNIEPELGLVDKLKDLKDRPEQLVPFINSVPEISNILKVGESASKLERGEDLTTEEMVRLREFLSAGKQGKSLAYQVADVISGLPAFVGEFALTGGAYSLGKEAAIKGLQRILTKEGMAVVEKKLAGRIATKVATGLVGAAVQTLPSGAARIPEGVLYRQQGGQEFGAALRDTLTDQFIEIASERAGGLLSEIPLPKKLAAIRDAVTARWVSKVPGRTAEQLQKIVEKTGWHGPLGEIFEERVGDVAKYATGLQASPIPSLQQLAVEGLAFSLPGVVEAGANKVLQTKTPAPQTLIDYAINSPLTTAEDKAKIEKLVESGVTSTEDVQAILSGESSTPPVVESKEVKSVSRPQEPVSSSVSEVANKISTIPTTPEATAKTRNIIPENIQAPETKGNIAAVISEPFKEPAEAPPAEVKPQPSATESQLKTTKEVTDELADSSVRPETLKTDSLIAPGRATAPDKSSLGERSGYGTQGTPQPYVETQRKEVESGTTTTKVGGRRMDVQEPSAVVTPESRTPDTALSGPIARTQITGKPQVADIPRLNEAPKSGNVPTSAKVDKEAVIEPSAHLRPKAAATERLTDWGSRLKTIAQSKNLDDLQALSDEMAAHKDDPRVVRLRTSIQEQIARARQPEIPEREPEKAVAPKPVSKAAQKTLSQAERPEGKTIRAAPTHRIGAPKADASRNSLEQQVRAHGGIKDDTDQAYKGELKWLSESAKRGAVNQTGGISVEQMATKLAQDGYGKGVWWEGSANNVDPQAFLQAVMDDARGSAKHYSTERDEIEDDPDVKAWDTLVEDETGKALIERVQSGHAKHADIVQFVREASAHGLSDNAIDAFVASLQRTVQEELSGGTEESEGYQVDEEGNLLDPDGSVLFAREFQLGLPNEGLSMQEAHKIVRDLNKLPKVTTNPRIERLLNDDNARVREAAKSLSRARSDDVPRITDLTAAIDKLSTLKHSETPIADYLRQRSMFEEADLSGEQKALLQAVNRVPVTEMGRFVATYLRDGSVDTAEKATKPESGQSSMFAKGEAPLAADGEQPSFGVEGNRVSLANKAARDLFNQAYQHLSGEKGRVAGVFEQSPIGLANEIEGLPNGERLANAIRSAAKTGKGKVVIFSTEKSRRHEIFHESSYKANRYLEDRHSRMASLQSGPDWMVMRAQLMRMGYPDNPATLVEEAAAHIAEGSYDKLGLTRDEAVEWMFKWFTSFSEKNPSVNPREFQEMSDEATKARDEVYRTESNVSQPQSDQTLPGVQEGREGGDRASLARERKVQELIDSPGFKKWKGKARFVAAEESLEDAQTGEPIVVEGFHGTTHDFESVSTDLASIESDFGKGFYVSNTAEDVAENYAGFGPDLTNRIERLSDQLANDEDLEAEFDEKVTSGELSTHASITDYIRDEAKRRLTEHEGLTMKVFVKMENPLVLGGEGEPYWDLEIETDEEGEFTGEESGQLLDFVNALRSAASRYDDGEVEDAIQFILGDFEGIKPTEAIDRLRKTENFGYYIDENGDLASSEIIREAIERMGYDGIIDNTVNEKFGSARQTGKMMAGMHSETSHVIVWSPTQIKSATGNRGTFDPNNPNILFARSGDPWADLMELSDEFGRLANEPALAEGEKPRSLPKTLEAAGLEAGPERGYLPESIVDDGVERAKQAIAEKGIDGAMEFVRTGDGIEWASTGYEVSGQLRAEEANARNEGRTAEADAIRDKRLKFLDDFAMGAIERGRSIVGIKAIAEYAPDRMAYMLNKSSLKKRKRGISPEEESRITKLGEELGALEDRNKALEKALDAAKSQAKRRAAPTQGKAKKSDYQSRLDEQAQTVLQTLKPKVGKFDLSGLERPAEKGALTIGIPPLPGDAELIAQYAAAQLGKLNTVADLNAHLLSEFGQELDPYLPKIRQRAYAIRQEARLAEIESEETEPKRRKTILSEIQKEIGDSLRTIREAQKAQDLAAKAERAAERKSERAEARLAAQQTREQEHEARKQEIKQARVELKRLRQEMKEASKAETKGYRESIKAQKEAARKAELWDTPIRNEAEAARARLASVPSGGSDIKDPQVMQDLVSVAAAKFLPEKEGGTPRTGAVEPARVYRDLKDEFPALVTKKNQAEIYKRGYQRIQDATAAARESARMRSASAESKRLWDELGVDVDAQAVLIQQAEVRRQTDELRRKAVAEFNRVNKTVLERVWMEAQSIPRSLQSSIDSPIGRQGWFFVLTHPVQTLKVAIPATTQGYGAIHTSDYARHEADLRKHPDYQLAQQADLDLTEISSVSDPALQAEEQFQSQLATKYLPHVRLSEQGYVLTMNAIRLTHFSRLAALGKAEDYTFESNPEFFKQAAAFINNASGRGTMPEALKRASALLNMIFFSTRLNISRVQLINDLVNPAKYMGYDPVMRKQVAFEALRLARGLAIVYATAAALGLRLEFDPDDPDSFLIRFRNTRYDITGGEAGTVRFLFRMLKGIGKMATGQELERNEEPTFLALKFLRYKLAPLPAGVIDALTGKDAVGQPANLRKFDSPKQVFQQNVIIKRLFPMVAGQFVDSVSEEGWIGIPLAAPALTGLGVSSYPDRGIRAIKNQAVVDTLEDLKITSQSLLGQKTKDDELDKAIESRIMAKVETLDIPSGATDIGKEKIIRERLAQIRLLAKAESALADPERYKHHLSEREAGESLSFLTDDEKKTLTEDDLKAYRQSYAENYLKTLQRVASSDNYQKADDDKKEKILARVGQAAHTLAKVGMVQTKRKGTP